jgi:hypothetical protein
MKSRIEVHSQAEFDACVKAGNIAVVIGCSVEARGNSSVVARGNSSVVAWENSSVEAWENSSVVAWENSSVVARGNSSVEAWGNVFLRLWSALKIKASAHVIILKHGEARQIEGGIQKTAFTPETGEEWCEYFGIDPKDAPFAVPNIDAKILDAIKTKKAKGLDMGSWHGTDKVDETNWCGTTHCRAGYAICLAGKPGFDLERKYGPETAGSMIYAASRPNEPLPDFHATTADAMADIRECAARQAS